MTDRCSFVAVGISVHLISVHALPGWKRGSAGYHGDGGYAMVNHNSKLYAETYTKGDVIGCGVNLDNDTAYFTKNGKYLGQSSHSPVYASPV
jgi:hypothetical protein